MTTATLRDPRWSPARACARCGENTGPDAMVYSRHTGAWYCGNPDACTARVRVGHVGPLCPYVASPIACNDPGCRVHGEDTEPAPVDPEYADVDETGQLALGVPGEQRALDGLAPTREESAR